MNEVVVIVEQEESQERLLRLAHAVGDLMGASVRVVDCSGEPADLRLDDLSGVEAFVMTSEAAEEAQCWSVIQHVSRPIVLLPAAADAPPAIKTALLPVEGLEPDPVAAEMAHVLADHGVEVVALHVFDARNVPPFWDQAAHAPVPWRQEFVRRHVPEGAHLRLRRGPTGAQVLAEADRQEVDLIVLVWSQDLSHDRAHTVRHVLTRGGVPVMLVGARGGSPR